MDFNGDFQEEDVWSQHVVKKKLSITSKMIPRAKIATISNNESTHVPKQSSVGVLKKDEDCDDIGMLPPHEYLAKRVARSQIDPPSMCEGVGRPLKGKDLIRTRNAILTKTGFLKKK
ncbi:hypothetical protein EJD97_004969 [Solanum chilense]|uniref:Uncharacterized protein n=1 Tax=Solanum chilense TaxID=4083 RepID=A0A6N2BSD1_SOLCI|nr:hypothetical protein EJD97_004969 [Solanum chilense]